MNEQITSISWRSSSHNTDEPDQFITKHTGYAYNEFEGTERLIAKLRFYYLDLELGMSLGYSVFSMLDSMDETLSLLGPVYDVEQPSTFTAGLDEQLNILDCALNVLFYDELEVLPAFRGYGITSSLMSEAERLFASRAMFSALNCRPLQFVKEWRSDDKSSDWQKSVAYQKLEQDDAVATKRLSAYYESLGFQRTSGEMAMVRAIDC